MSTRTKIHTQVDLGKSFEGLKELIGFTWTKYKGILIEKCSEGYKVANQTYPSIEAAKESIDTPLKARRTVQ